MNDLRIMHDTHSALKNLAKCGEVTVPMAEVIALLDASQEKDLQIVSIHEIDCDGLGIRRPQLLLHFNASDFSDLSETAARSMSYTFFRNEVEEHVSQFGSKLYAEIYCA